jgi:phage terminase large subunit
VFGGGFGNGKTTSAVVKALQLARDYPGSNGLIARSTYPKLNDTIRKEFIKWCPEKWIARKALSVDNVIELTNGSVINFRYIQQQGKSNESSTSNLLSATYDWIVVDQIEDPEISEKDFNDLLGRLRGNAPYVGEDDTMPRSGPRWFIACCNPTRNWVFRKLVKPMQDYKVGIMNPDLLIDVDTGKPMIELYEGSTYTNAENLPEDFIKTLEATYRGQMRTRYLMGEWGAFEGLVYPQYDPSVHMLSPTVMLDYLTKLVCEGFDVTLLEAYDHGIAKQACYGQGFADNFGNVFLLDGYYEKEKTVEQLADLIKAKREGLHNVLGYAGGFDKVLADPSIFRRVSGSAKTVGVSTAGLFREQNIAMIRANNDILSGIAKVQSYLAIDKFHEHPITGNVGSPRLFISNELTWFDQEIVDYYWNKDTAGEYEDKPNGKNDHSMDMLKYLLTHRPRLAQLVQKPVILPPRYLRWQEHEIKTRHSRSHRHAA